MIEKRIFDWAIWFIAGCLLLILLTSCAPLTIPTYAPTETPSPTATAEPFETVTIARTETLCTVSTGVPAGNLNLRTGAGVNHSVIAVLQEKEVLTVIAFGDWLEVVDAQGRRGFINSQYCDMGDWS